MLINGSRKGAGMRLVCAACGNYTFFTADVETVQVVSPSPQGLVIQDQDREGAFDSGGWIRLGLLELVEYCERQDKESLRWDAEEGCFVNSHITCGRCGSRKVSIPYRSWSPPRPEMSLEQEIHHNREEFAQLRKERQHVHPLPDLR